MALPPPVPCIGGRQSGVEPGEPGQQSPALLGLRAQQPEQAACGEEEIYGPILIALQALAQALAANEQLGASREPITITAG